MEEKAFDPNMFEEEILALEQKIIEWQAKEDLIIFYGSSSFRLWNDLAVDLSPLNVINLGFGGSSFGWCVHYYNRLFKKINPPKHIVLYGGDNDLDNGLSPEMVMKRFRKLVSMMREDFPITPISVLTIKPSPCRNHLQPQIRLTNSLIRKDMIGLPKAYQVNTFDAMLDANGFARPELYLEDELHMNRNGYEIWKGVIRKHFGI